MNAAEAIAAELSILPKGQGGGKFPPKRQRFFLPRMPVQSKKDPETLVYWDREVKYIKGQSGMPSIRIPRTSPTGKVLPDLVTSKMLVVLHEHRAGLLKKTPYETGRKSEELCWSTGHTKPGTEGDAGQYALFGAYDTKQWAQQLQMKGSRTLQNSEGEEVPGERQDCYSCKLLNLDDSDRECRLNAPLTLTILKVWDAEEEVYVEPKGGPIMAFLYQNESSAESLPRYARRLSQSGVDHTGIVTEISLFPRKNGNFSLTYNEYGEDQKAVGAAIEAFDAAKAAWQADRDAYIAKMTAARDATGPARGAANDDYAPKAEAEKPKASKAEPKAKPAPQAAAPSPSEEPSDDDCPF